MISDPCICANLRQAALSSTIFYDEVLLPSGLRVTMFRLLRRIDEQSHISITDLADIVALDRSTLGRNIRVLEKQNLVRVSAGDDGRTRCVELTKAGSLALTEALPLWNIAQTRMKQVIGSDLQSLLDSLNQLSELGSATEGNA